MIKVAIVGNIASGKSELEKYLFNSGFVVLDTDVMAHDILVDKPDVAKAFEEYDVFEYGLLSREKLGKLVFSNEELKEKLESIVHPLILENIEESFETFADEDFVFVSVPLLFEVGWQEMFDKIIFIKADDEIRLERLIKRNGYSREYAQTRLDSQLSQETKITNSDYVIENNSSKEEFYKNIESCLDKLIKR
ncbi:dephospho-CoA kinase [bacterium]|nr:dephospho-CoA kinase [bacterium]